MQGHLQMDLSETDLVYVLFYDVYDLRDTGERGDLAVYASESGSRGRGVKPCFVLEQGTFTPQKYW